MIIVGVTPLNSQTLRVFFDEEPKHRSNLSPDDALYRFNYTLALISGGLRVTEPVITGASNPRPAAAEEIDLATYPDAYTIDLGVDRPIVWDAAYELTGSANIANFDGSATLTPSAVGFPGIYIIRPRRLPRARRARMSVDLRYETFEQRWRTDEFGDLQVHEGEDFVRKKLIRRFLSTPGGFVHLREYGAGLRLKQKINATAQAQLRARIRDQALREPEVDTVRVAINADVPDTLIVGVSVTLTSQRNLRLSFELPVGAEAIRVAA